MKAVTTIFTRSKSRHYYKGTKRVTLATLRRYIAQEKPFKVLSSRGKDMTAKAISHAIAYQYLKKRKFVSSVKKAQKVLSKV